MSVLHSFTITDLTLCYNDDELHREAHIITYRQREKNLLFMLVNSTIQYACTTRFFPQQVLSFFFPNYSSILAKLNKCSLFVITLRVDRAEQFVKISGDGQDSLYY